MKRFNFLSTISLFSFLLAGNLQAASVPIQPDQILKLSVDTSSLAGTSGSIDLQFNPGPNTFESATVAVTGLEGVTSTSDQQTGAVSGGPFPNKVTLANSGFFNEDLEDVIFSNAILLNLDFSGVAINSPTSQKPQSGSTFTIGIFSDPNASIPASIDLGGVAFEADITASGNFTAVLSSPQASIVPEPSYLPFMLLLPFLFAVKRSASGADRGPQ